MATQPNPSRGTHGLEYLVLTMLAAPAAATTFEVRAGPVVPSTVHAATTDDVVTIGGATLITTRGTGEALEGGRPTTSREEVMGELRSWAFLPANWDGEGASSADSASIREAVSFVSLLTDDMPTPEPMLLASGRAGLFWDSDELYADLEFTGAGRVTYYIERRDDNAGKHKGGVNFNSKSETMPAVFSVLLANSKAVAENRAAAA